MWQASDFLKDDVQLFRTELEIDNFISLNPTYYKTEVDYSNGAYTQLAITLIFDTISLIPVITFDTVIVERDYRPEIFITEDNGKTILKAYIYYLNEDYKEAFKEVFTTLLTPLFTNLKSQTLSRQEKVEKIITTFASVTDDRLIGYIKQRKELNNA